MEANVSKNTDDWKWSNVHIVEWQNLPWSKTPLKFLFHRSTHAGGNTNTPHVSKYGIKKNYKSPVISSNHAANYKMII